ncbi:elongation factor 2 [Striga asiatica]|uniref:Elongation factor 2 n=1 Tax=Striga asiatica TaxID=4170 RepID=A0A5A7QAE3_STRAF|nr:elongation factor 2 [Striga asiatica]
MYARFVYRFTRCVRMHGLELPHSTVSLSSLLSLALLLKFTPTPRLDSTPWRPASPQILMDDLEQPIVPFYESVHFWSDHTVMSKSRDTRNRLYMKARPLKAGLAKAIDDGLIGPNDDPEARSKILHEEFDWDKDLANNIWSFGPNTTGPNILVNKCKGGAVDEIKEFVVAGFQRASNEGPLAGERMRGVCFELCDAVIDDRDLDELERQIIETAERAMHAAYLSATPRLLEPMYLVEFQAMEPDLDVIHRAMYDKCGHVFKMEEMPGNSMLYNCKAYLPVMGSVGLFADLRAKISGEIFTRAVIDHWDIMYPDPMNAETEPGKMVQETRRRKGLGEMKRLSDYEDEL